MGGSFIKQTLSQNFISCNMIKCISTMWELCLCYHQLDSTAPCRSLIANFRQNKFWTLRNYSNLQIGVLPEGGGRSGESKEGRGDAERTKEPTRKQTRKEKKRIQQPPRNPKQRRARTPGGRNTTEPNNRQGKKGSRELAAAGAWEGKDASNTIRVRQRDGVGLHTSSMVVGSRKATEPWRPCPTPPHREMERWEASCSSCTTCSFRDCASSSPAIASPREMEMGGGG